MIREHLALVLAIIGWVGACGVGMQSTMTHNTHLSHTILVGDQK